MNKKLLPILEEIEEIEHSIRSLARRLEGHTPESLGVQPYQKRDALKLLHMAASATEESGTWLK